MRESLFQVYYITVLPFKGGTEQLFFFLFFNRTAGRNSFPYHLEPTQLEQRQEKTQRGSSQNVQPPRLPHTKQCNAYHTQMVM